MNESRQCAAHWLAQGIATVVVTVQETAGSAPREAGARMLVSEQQCTGTIGGGHLELTAIAQARALLPSAQTNSNKAAITTPLEVRYPLGPALGQCCGGVVILSFNRLTHQLLAAWPNDSARFHLQLYGAGHVGRAIAELLARLPVVVDWIDEREDEFPSALDTKLSNDFGLNVGSTYWPEHIRKVAVDAVEAEVDLAPPGCNYLVLTHQHDLDLRITEAILRRGDFGFLGLIGSKTKRQRFVHQLTERGIEAALLDRIVCPIGVQGIEGKQPEVVALAVVAQLLQLDSNGR